MKDKNDLIDFSYIYFLKKNPIWFSSLNLTYCEPYSGWAYIWKIWRQISRVSLCSLGCVASVLYVERQKMYHIVWLDSMHWIENQWVAKFNCLPLLLADLCYNLINMRLSSKKEWKHLFFKYRGIFSPLKFLESVLNIRRFRGCLVEEFE